MITEPMVLVTVKLNKSPSHDPHNKVTGGCFFSRVCTDSTGEHHTTLIRESDVNKFISLGYHVTRMEHVPVKMDWLDDHLPSLYQPTPAQETMRREMEHQPQRLGSVLDDELGALPEDERVGTIATDIISRSNLTLTMAQWTAVQTMVEQAIEAGQALGGSVA